MKKLLLLVLLISNLSFGQEAVYQLNGILTSSYDGDAFLPTNDGIYYTNIFTSNEPNWSYHSSISFLPKNGQSGWKKTISFPAYFIPTKTTITPCNLSNNLIISIQSINSDFCSILKIDPDGVIIWSKMIEYSGSAGTYGSNANPLSINEQDEITVSLAPANMLFLSKLNTNGDLIFSKSIHSLNYGDGKNPAFATIPTSDAGYFITMKAGSNPTVIKLNANLQVDWAKKWSIDSYSHPKIATLLPNGNYCIIGEGDNSTYIAQVDPNGHLLSYKYGIPMMFPYQSKALGASSIEIVDSYGRSLKVDLPTNVALLESRYNNMGYGFPVYLSGKQNFLDVLNSSIYFDLESDQPGCLNRYTEPHILSELTVYSGSITNETVMMENNGNITDYLPVLSTTNDVSLTLTCGSNLGVEETEKSALTLYPNPVSAGKKVNLALEKSAAAKLRILTLSGKVIEVSDFSQSIFQAPQEAGMYFVQLLDQAGNVIAVEKLVVE